MKLQYVGAALVLGGLFFLGGCAKSGDSTATTSGSGSTPSTGTSGSKPSVVYIPKNTGNAYFDSVIAGFQKAGQEKGFDFTTVAPATADAASQIQFIQQQVQRGVSAIAISPNSTDAVAPALKEAMSKGIKVISIDADLEKNESARDATILPVDPTVVGASQIELMSGLIGGKGEFAILSATTDAPNQNKWIAAMKDTLKQPKYQGMKLVEVVYGNDEPQKSQRETEALLTKFPNLKGIIAPTSVGIVAAAQALETAQAAKRVQLTGLGLPSQMKAFVQRGTVQKFALWDPGKMGYAAGYLISGLLDKSVKPASGGSFKAGDAALKFGTNNVIYACPPLVFDSKNIDQYKF